MDKDELLRCPANSSVHFLSSFILSHVDFSYFLPSLLRRVATTLSITDPSTFTLHQATEEHRRLDGIGESTAAGYRFAHGFIARSL